MSKHSFARFTAKALIVAAVILFILGMIPVIAVAVGGLGAGWAAGSRLWAVGPLACCACGGSLFLLAFGAMLLVLTRIQGNLGGWRQRQIEAAQARAVARAPEEPPTLALAAEAAVPVAAAPEPVTAGEEVLAIEAQAEAPAVAAGAALVGAEAAIPEPGALGAAVGEGEAVLAMPEPELEAPEEEAGQPGRGAVLAGAGIAAAAVLAHEEEAEPTVSEAEAMAPQVEAGAPEGERRGPGLGAVLAGAGIAAAAAVAHEEKAETAADEVAEAEAASTPVEGAAAEVEPGGVGLGVALAGAGVAAAIATGEESEPEPTPIPESAPEPEPGAPLVEILEEEELPTSADEAGILGSGEALAVAGLAAVAREGEQEEVTIGSVVLEPDSPEIQAEGETEAEVTAPEVEAPAAPEAQAPVTPARQVAWAYDQGTSNVAKAVGVQHTQGVGQVYAGKLREVGITTTAALLRAGSTPKGRKELAEKTGISQKQILKWINHVDLARIKGISEQYADLLEWAGVDTVPALAQRNADNLLQKLTEVNEARRLVRRLPTLGMVASWIAQAKELPRIVVYK